MRSRKSLFTLALVAASVGPASLAHAQHSAAVLDFEGRGASAARAMVVTIAGESLDLVPRREAESVAREAGVDIASAEGMETVAAELRLSAFISGSVEGPLRRPRVTVVVHNYEGREIAVGERIRLRPGRRGRRRFAREIADVIEDAVAELEANPPDVSSADYDDEEQPEQLRDSEIAGEDDEDEDQEDDEDDDGPPRARPLAEIMLGLSGRTRDAEVALADGTTRVYDSGLFPELALALTLNPIANSGLFIRGVGAIGLGLTSVDEARMNEDIGTSVYRLRADVGYFLDLDALSVGAMLGAGLDAFELDENAVMTSAQYTFVRPGIAGRFNIVDGAAHDVFLQLDAGLRLALSVGDLAPTFGESGSAFGFDAQVSLGGAFEMGLLYALRIGFTSYSLSFEGQGAMPAETAEDGSDNSVVVTLQGGWAL